MFFAQFGQEIDFRRNFGQGEGGPGTKAEVVDAPAGDRNGRQLDLIELGGCSGADAQGIIGCARKVSRDSAFGREFYVCP